MASLGSMAHIEPVIDVLDRNGLGQAYTLLRLLSCLPDGPIPYDMLLLAEFMTGSELFWGLTGPRLTALLYGLRDAGLAELSTTPDGIDVIYIDADLRTVVRADLDDSGQRPACVALWSTLMYFATANEIAGAPDDPGGDAGWDLLAPIEAHLFDLVITEFPTSEEYVDPAANAALHAADHLAETGRVVEARTEAAKVFEGCRRALGPDHTRTLLAAAFTATFTGRAGDARAAVDLFADVLARRITHFPADHEDTDFARYAVALWTGRAGDSIAAAGGYGALAAHRALHRGGEHPDTLRARCEMAYWMASGGDVRAARRIWSALLPVLRRVFGEDDDQTRETERDLLNWGEL